MPEGYALLAASIVRTVCDDYLRYKRASIRAARRREYSRAFYEAERLRNWFFSPWAEMLMDMEPDAMLKILDETAERTAR